MYFISFYFSTCASECNFSSEVSVSVPIQGVCPVSFNQQLGVLAIIKVKNVLFNLPCREAGASLEFFKCFVVI